MKSDYLSVKHPFTYIISVIYCFFKSINFVTTVDRHDRCLSCLFFSQYSLVYLRFLKRLYRLFLPKSVIQLINVCYFSFYMVYTEVFSCNPTCPVHSVCHGRWVRRKEEEGQSEIDARCLCTDGYQDYEQHICACE